MSSSTSTTSPISEFSADSDDLTADLDLRFDRAEDILRSSRKRLRPDPDLTVLEWADAHRGLSSRGAAEPRVNCAIRTGTVGAAKDYRPLHAAITHPIAC